MTTRPSGPGSRMTPDARREQLLAIGSDLFRDSDYDDVWIEEVARRAGVSRGLLYHYFPTKRDYFLAVVDHNAAQHRISDEPEPGLDAQEQLRLSLRRWLSTVSPGSRAYLSTHALRQTDPDVRTLVDGHLRIQEERTLRRVMTAIGGPADEAPEPLRLAVHGWMEGSIVMVISWLESPAAERIAQESLVELLAGSFESALHHAFVAVGKQADPAGDPVAPPAPEKDPRPGATAGSARMSPEARRRQLLQVGSDLFADSDYDDVWIEEVAVRAGISRGLLYHYFPTKRDFYVAVVQFRGERLLARDGDIEGLPPDQQLRASLRLYLDHVRSGPLSYRTTVESRHTETDTGPVVQATITEYETRTLARIMASVGSDEPAPHGVVLTVRGWQAFVHTVATTWLDGGTTPREDLVDLLAGVLEGMLLLAFGLPAPDRVEGLDGVSGQSNPSPKAASTSDRA